MPPLLQHIGLLGVGLLMLILGGKLLVSAAVDTARRLGVPQLLVGLTLVAWGTSAPELALNLISAFKGRGELALGNVVGANICNMGPVIGIAALLRPLKVQERLIRVETILNAAMLSLLAVFGLVGHSYQRWEAGLMLAAFGAYSVWTVAGGLRQRRSRAVLVPTTEPEGYPLPPMSWWRISISFLAGLALLGVGGSLASDAAVGIAGALGVPRAIIGVTIVAIGTTLPELVTSIMATRRGQVDLAMGNAIGSCLFNAGAIFGLAGLISPPEAPRSMIVSLVVMMVFAGLLVPVARTHQRTVARIEGALLLALYGAFLVIQAVIAARGAS